MQHDWPVCELELRPAAASELAAVSALCLRSKAHWGYDANFIEACRPELTLHADELESSQIQLAVRGERMLGVAQLSIHSNQAELQKLFIEPDWIGKGIGQQLLGWARTTATQHKAVLMTVAAEPDALPFYQKAGFEKIGEEASGSIPGRFLPLCKLDL